MEMILVSSMMIAPFLASKYAKRFPLSKFLFIDFFACALLIAIMALTPSPFFIRLFSNNLIPYISFTIICFLVTMIATTANIALNSMFQKIVPLEMLGRVGTVMGSCCMAIMPLGLLLFGILFDNISSWLCVLIGSAILFAAVLIFKKPLLSYHGAESDSNQSAEVVDIV
jgi:hypothetical protein